VDPLSQGALGAVAAQCLAKKSSHLLPALLIGALSGMAPDLDIFIRSSTDHLLALEYHRQFTHSLIFIPVGGAFCGYLLWWLFFRQKLSAKEAIVFGILGWSTHGLLDACTSYGTLLLWPFSDLRVAWNNIGIIDPIPTFLWCAGAWLAAKSKKRMLATLGLILGCLYLAFGLLQRERASRFQDQLIQQRGHTVQRRTVKPTIFQLFLWRSLYESQGKYHVDALRVGLKESRVYPGSTLDKFRMEEFLTANPTPTQTHRDIERFSKFSDNWVAYHPEETGVIGDVRYSLLPYEISPLWGIRLNPSAPNEHLRFENFRTASSKDFEILKKMILGRELSSEKSGP
jgi:inner membrane protein